MQPPMLLLSWILAAALSLGDSVVIRVENLPERCDYESKCPRWRPDKLNVHLVPHTHDDVGWLKTVDQYYYGLRNDIQNAGVQYILDTVVEELIRNKERRFIYVETAFWWKWWREQDAEMRSVVHELIQTGQLELVSGGWSMPDEATTHYNSIIDQFSWGLRRLNDTFGPRCGVPRVAWQIDPFGHSREVAGLLAQMNYDALFIARQHYRELENRRRHRTLEHVWRGSDDLGAAGDLFTSMMDMHQYGPPRGFDWDGLDGSSDPPVVDDPDSEEYNLPQIVDKFVRRAAGYAAEYATNHVMFPMGTDFNYQAAHNWFKNMDKLIGAVNLTGPVHVAYSTPSCYAKALWDAGRRWSFKSDDFFPYASDPHSYWTGFYTSRPALKRMERVGNNWLQACKQVDTLAGNRGRFESRLTRLREAMGVMQHHDAVAGTEKQAVANDYAKQLQAGINQCQQLLSDSYGRLAVRLGKRFARQYFCPRLNISQCPATETGRSVAVTLYNPQAHRLDNHMVRIPVSEHVYYRVLDAGGRPVPAVLVPIPPYVQAIPGRDSIASHELVFRVRSLPPLGLVTYTVQASATRVPGSAAVVAGIVIDKQTELQAKNLTVVFDQSGRLAGLVYRNQTPVAFEQSFHYYQAAVSNGTAADQSSGAYVFRPASEEPFPAGRVLSSTLYLDPSTGLQEVHQRFDSWLEQVVRVNPDRDEVEFEFVVGPIPVEDRVGGKEVVTRYRTNLNNRGLFRTDANGRQMMKRRWSHTVNEPVSSNYYPVNSRIALADHSKQLELLVLTDRSQGGTCPRNGTIELMVHRRLLNDDGFGVAEPLNETGADGRGLVIRAQHLVLLSRADSSAAQHRPLAQKTFLAPVLSFGEIGPTGFLPKSHLTEFSGLRHSSALPDNVHLLTLEQWSGDSYLLRLEHFYQRDEHPELSRPVQVDLADLFEPFKIVAARELTLAANQDVTALQHRLKFDYAGVDHASTRRSQAENRDSLQFKLEPMQIRTFLVQVGWNY